MWYTRSTTVSPLATRPASTRQADARRSVAMIGAPLMWSTPCTIAVLPSRRMSAPRRCNSCACMKRFSNTVSVTTPVPSATQLSAVNCACMSVGKAGYGAVLMLTAFGRRPPMSSSIQSSPVEMCAPASSSLASTASSVLARAWRARTLPPVIAAPTRKVPVSMRSGSTLYSTPCITKLELPAPSICAPIAIRQCARSTTSGSCAALSITVVPCARVAAIMMFSVPVTVTMSTGDPGGLLAGGRSHLLDQLGRLLDGGDELGQGLARRVGDLHAGPAEPADLLGRRLAPLGELPDLGRHDLGHGKYRSGACMP